MHAPRVVPSMEAVAQRGEIGQLDEWWEKARRIVRPGRRAVPLIRRFAGAIHGGVPRPIDGPDPGVVCATASMQRSSAPGALGDRSARRLDGQLVDRTPSTAGEMWDRTRLVQNPRLAEFAGRRPTHRFNVGLLAMQKPLGPTPIGRK
jgi:hypothetical protein